MTCCEQPSESQRRYKCEKHQLVMCDACLRCKDPELYCKFRPACMIHFLEKERKNGRKQASKA